MSNAAGGGLPSLPSQRYPGYKHPRLRYIAAHRLVLLIDDSTEAVIQRKIEAMQRLIREEPEQAIQISSIAKRHFQLQIETLQNAPGDAAKLEQIIKAKEREHKEATDVYETERLHTEIEMLKFVLFLVNRNIESSKT